MPLKARNVKAALLGKGFKEAKNKDHHYYYLYIAGKKSSINTKISHNEKEIGDALVSAMARQIKLTTPMFKDFVSCPLTGEAYLRILIEQKHVVIPPDDSSKAEGSG